MQHRAQRPAVELKMAHPGELGGSRLRAHHSRRPRAEPVLPWTVYPGMAESTESLIDNRFVSVRRTLRRLGLVRVVRTSVAIETLEQVDEVWGAVSRALIPLDRSRHVLLMDMRDAPGRNDDAFERRVAKYRSATVQGFLRVAVLVRSLPGQLQVQRHAREDGLGMVHIFAAEPAALEWLTNGSG